MDRDYEVMGIGRSSRKPECFSLGIEFPYYAYHLTYELEYVLERIRAFKPEIVVNFAAQGEGAASFGADNWRFYETNCVGLTRLCAGLDVGRFIQIGSSEVYGGNRSTPATEESELAPTSPYGVSKAAFDQHLLIMWKHQGLPMNIVRPSNCYCPGQQLHRVIPKALVYGLTGRRMPLHGGGRSRKSYLHATDLSDAIERVFRAPLGEVYNVAPDEPTSIREVVSLCAAALKMPFEALAEEAPERFGQDSIYWMDSSKIKALGWKQEIGWTNGLGTMVNWLRHYPELYHMPDTFTMRA